MMTITQKCMGGEVQSVQSQPTSATLRLVTDSRSSRCIDARSVKKQRTEWERRRRHLFGDVGAKFKSRIFALGKDRMSALTTVPEKDNIIFEILWI